MATITARTTVDATPERVWEVLSDFGGISKAAPHITGSALTSEQTQGVGTSRHCDFAMPGMATEETITDWRDGEGYDIEVKMRGMPMRKTHARFDIDEVDGAALLTATVEYALPFGPIGRAMNRVVGGKMTDLWSGMLAGYKERAETGNEIGKDTELTTSSVEIARSAT